MPTMRASTAELFARVRALIEQGKMPNGDVPVAVATASASGEPSARFVLLKAFDERGPVFYTNLQSRKGRDLIANPRVELLFYWPAIAHQIRIAGTTERVEDAVADAYWKTRPRESQLASAASPQSDPFSHEELAARIESMRKEYAGKDVPRPSHWTGVRTIPTAIEFWHAGEFRFHERERWERRGPDAWEGTPLAP